MDYYDSIEKQEEESYHINRASNSTSNYNTWLFWMMYYNPLFWIISF